MFARWRARGVIGVVLTAVLLLSSGAHADGSMFPPIANPGMGSALASDFRFLANNLVADTEDAATAPLYLPRLLRDKRTYWTALFTGAAIGGSIFLLDNRLRDAVRNPKSKTAREMQSTGAMLLWGTTGLLYAYGLTKGDTRAREIALTTIEATGVTGFITQGSKLAFGRARPKQNQGPRAFGTKGRSFISSATTPAFVLAAGISEYWNNRWYAAVPAYGTAAAVGFARMRRDAHWFSDVLASAAVGVGTTKLLLHMHDRNAANPSRFRIFPVVMPGGAGVQASYIWGGETQAVSVTSHSRAPTPAVAVAPELKAWVDYQQGAFVKPVLDGQLRWDPSMPEVDFGLAPN